MNQDNRTLCRLAAGPDCQSRLAGGCNFRRYFAEMVTVC